MQIIASPAALRRLRHALSSEFPAAGHGHLTEALAASLGFGSHAALKVWMDEHPKDTLALRTVRPADFILRLDELSNTVAGGLVGSMQVQVGLARAILSCRLNAEGLGYDEVVHLHGMPHARPAAFFAAGMRHLDEFLAAPHRGVLAFVDAGRPASGMHLTIAACCARYSDADPEMADFLVDWLLDAHAAAALPPTSAADWGHASLFAAWGEQVYRTFRPRIFAFRDAVCRLWSDDLHPSALPAPGRPRRARRPRTDPHGDVLYPDVAVSLGAERVEGTVSFFDAGRAECDPALTDGLITFALWRAGAAKGALHDFIRHETPPDAEQRWITIRRTTIPAFRAAR